MWQSYLSCIRKRQSKRKRMGQIKFETQLSFIETNFSRLVYYDVSGDKEIMLNCETKTQRCRFCGNENRVFSKKRHTLFRIQLGIKS